MFALIKRVGEKDENLASSFYSIMLSTNFLTLFLVSKLIFPVYLINEFLLKSSFFIVFFVLHFVCKFYFLKKQNYRPIIAYYDQEYTNKKKYFAVIGILYFIFSPTVFLVSAIWLSKI